MAGRRRSQVSLDTFVVEELFREYLTFMGYGHSLSVFAAEATLPEDDKRLSREVLASEMGVSQNAESRALPLVFGIVETLRTQNRDAAEGR